MLNSILIKLSSRCNLDCSYCYWFRDESVRRLPARMSEEIEGALVRGIEAHIVEKQLSDFVCSFHGGEPLLFGLPRMRVLLAKLEAVQRRTACTIRYAITTNGVLLNESWCSFLKDSGTSVTCSIDGPPDIHDSHRPNLKGGSTWRAAVDGYLKLCRAGISPAIIAVCNPKSDPERVLDHLAQDLGVRFCDVLMPDHNYDDDAPSIAAYYIRLFDHWYDRYFGNGLEVRLLADMVRGVLGLETRTDSIGYGPVETVCVNTDGSLETHDVLRIGGGSYTGLNVTRNKLSDIEFSNSWRSVRNASLSLHEKCLKCPFKVACGGGHLGQRWSRDRGYDN